MKTAVFGLTRGYKGFNKKKYKHVIQRNLALKRHMYTKNSEFILFHEGNISFLDKILIRVTSLTKIKFVDISADFKPFEGNIWTGQSDFPLGYSLMCQFQYYHVWKYLKDFDYAIRVDEDCVIEKLDFDSKKSVFQTGSLSREEHLRTQETLFEFFEELGITVTSDSLFPYTNVYITKPSFWLQRDVQEFLYLFVSHRLSLEYRWGDLPIIGTTLKKFLSYDNFVNSGIWYAHKSHNSKVYDGNIT
jgi:hypothetical protein